MTLVIHPGMTNEQIQKVLKRAANKPEQANLKMYCGFLKLNEDPMAIQNRLRNEW